MPSTKKPRNGSMQFWPRKKAKKQTARVRSWSKNDNPGILGFAGYKAGMTHILFTDNNSKSTTKGMEVQMPVTIIECPPLKIIAAKFYKKTLYGQKTISQINAKDLDKELARKIQIPKKQNKKLEDIKEYDDIKVMVQTQPKTAKIGKKKPEIFEMGLGGKKEDKLNYVKENLGSEISISNIFKEGQQVDIHSVTRGKGYQGPVKRFGLSIRSRKSEKTKRGPGSLGGWKGHAHFMHRVAHAGQMGYQLRTEYNKRIIKISENSEEINPKGGLINYGNINTEYILIKGGISGPKRRLIRFNKSIRANPKIPTQPPSISYISLESKQGA